MRAAGGSCQEMEPAVDFAVPVGDASVTGAGAPQSSPARAPFPATHPRSVYDRGSLRSLRVRHRVHADAIPMSRLISNLARAPLA
jgi:hypothetical protein